MVGAVLVQNTRWINVERAIAILRDRGVLSPQSIAGTEPGRLAAWIRPAGCQSVKSRRLIALSGWVQGNGGISRLRREPSETLRSALLQVRGVGPETADAILCFAFDRPVFIADRYARRWLGRLGVTTGEARSDYERCRVLVEQRLDWGAQQMQLLHGALVQFSQQVCRSAPACMDCFLRRHCMFYKNIRL
jgi:endonuclease-3 related protein